MNALTNNPKRSRLSRKQQMREAVLLSFCDRPAEEPSFLLNLRDGNWEKLLHWLDTSGLALYFYARI